MQEIRETQVRTWGWEDPLQQEMATCSSIPAWKIPGTEEPGGLQSVNEVTQSWTQLSAQAPRHTTTCRAH